MRRLISVLIVLLLSFFSNGVAAQGGVTSRVYTSEKLDGFWSNTLGSSSIELEWLSMLNPEDSIEPVEEVEALPLDVPFSGVIIGESSTDTTSRLSFPVIPIDAAINSQLIRRLAWSELYLNRYSHFSKVSTDSSEVLDELTTRQYIAGLEAYLITARFYFAAPTLEEKCIRLKRLKELDAGSLAGLQESFLPASMNDFVVLQQFVVGRLQESALADLVCSIDPVRGREEVARIVTTRVRENVIAEVRRKVEDTLQLLEQTSREFQTLVNNMDVEILSAQIIELERVLGNARANMLLVKEDQLDAQATLAQLEAVDLSELNKPDQLEVFETGRTQMSSMAEQINQVMNELSNLGDLSDAPGVNENLDSCKNLLELYLALDLSQDSGTLNNLAEEPYNDCLTQITQIIGRFQSPDANTVFTAELARHVKQISESTLKVLRQ